MASMATGKQKPVQIRRGSRAHLYITEHMKDKGLDDKKLGERLGVTRQTVWKWQREQWRLDPAKIAAIADALDVLPEQLWRRPAEKSLDKMIENEPPETKKKIEEMVSVWINKAS